MIGVIADALEHPAVREFFELFKTPWEFYQSEREYEVVLHSGDGDLQNHTAKLVLIYGGRQLPSESESGKYVTSQRKDTRMLSYQGMPIPIYGSSITFRKAAGGVLEDRDSGESALYLEQSAERMLVRIGYDLFGEIRTLLTVGQPAAHASIPALELHISILRDLIVASGIPLVEIPPVPDGYKFIACLTHDVDHPSIRLHKVDHTILGFLVRAILGSLINVFRGRQSLRDLLSNWAAALKLPSVHLGLARDFWAGFDRYPKLEKDVRSSFFLIPFKDRPGSREQGPAPRRRASRYGATEVATQVKALMGAGCEIGLHGIDAWLDSSKGREELEQIRSVTGAQDIGVRMHWLYFGEQTPINLEKAGANYDSTFGYNETVGYRAGTTQAYKPLAVMNLLELPLHVMDTALFYPCYLDLPPREASERVGRIIDNAVKFGGCVTVNWHDRSIAPERLWGDFYVQLVNELKNKGAWFATAAETVTWFRKRRSATFENLGLGSATPRSESCFSGSGLPAVCLRVHNQRELCADTAIGWPQAPFNISENIGVS